MWARQEELDAEGCGTVVDAEVEAYTRKSVEKKGENEEREVQEEHVVVQVGGRVHRKGAREGSERIGKHDSCSP